MHVSQKVKGVLMKSSTYYFHMKTEILADLQICISVPLIYKKLYSFITWWFIIWEFPFHLTFDFENLKGIVKFQ